VQPRPASPAAELERLAKQLAAMQQTLEALKAALQKSAAEAPPPPK
jgi:hypothetical protein